MTRADSSAPGKRSIMPPDIPDPRLRVLYYSHSGDVSGAEISLLLTISHMREVDTLLAAPTGELTDRAKRQGIHTIPVRSHRARMTRNPLRLTIGLLGTLRAGLELRAVVSKAVPDIVHANSIRAGLIAMVGVLGRRTRLIWHVRDSLPNNAVGKVIRWIAAWRVNTVFAISQAIESNFATSLRLRDKTVVVYNGIDVRTGPGQSVRDEIGTAKSRFVVGVVGQIAPWKRQHDAITAFADFYRDVPESELWVIGEPKFRAENARYLQELSTQVRTLGLAEKVQFCGFRADIPDVMASIDVLLVPSENEPFGRVVIEAMLAGKPVIGTRGGGIPEIVIDGDTGHLVDTGDTAAMAERLRTLYRERLRAQQMGERGQLRVYHTFSIQTKVQQMHDTYAQLLVSRPRREWRVKTSESNVDSQ